MLVLAVLCFASCITGWRRERILSAQTAFGVLRQVRNPCLRAFDCSDCVFRDFPFEKSAELAALYAFGMELVCSFFPFRRFVCNPFPAFCWDRMEYLYLGLSKNGLGVDFDGGARRIPPDGCWETNRAGARRFHTLPVPTGAGKIWVVCRRFPRGSAGRGCLPGPLFHGKPGGHFPPGHGLCFLGFQWRGHFWTACFWPCQNGWLAGLAVLLFYGRMRLSTYLEGNVLYFVILLMVLPAFQWMLNPMFVQNVVFSVGLSLVGGIEIVSAACLLYWIASFIQKEKEEEKPNCKREPFPGGWYASGHTHL